MNFKVNLRNAKQNGANIKNTTNMVLKICNTINQKGNNTSSTPNPQENNEKLVVCFAAT